MHAPFFQRFRPDDPLALAKSVEQDYEELTRVSAIHDELKQLEILSDLGSHLTMLEREQEAVPLLQQALALAIKLGEEEFEVANLLNLATAQQYLGQRELAQELFQEALEKARAYKQLEYEHFILHHRGRCYVEQGKIEEARSCFEQALVLRKEKGEPRWINSTQRALDAVRSSSIDSSCS